MRDYSSNYQHIKVVPLGYDYSEARQAAGQAMINPFSTVFMFLGAMTNGFILILAYLCRVSSMAFNVNEFTCFIALEAYAIIGFIGAFTTGIKLDAIYKEFLFLNADKLERALIGFPYIPARENLHNRLVRYCKVYAPNILKIRGEKALFRQFGTLFNKNPIRNHTNGYDLAVVWLLFIAVVVAISNAILLLANVWAKKYFHIQLF